jgi:diaminopimelate epimerase
MRRSFIKMNGLGNDFVIFDAREALLTLSATQISRIADRRHGVGCDQLVIIEPSGTADARMRIYNADGSEAEACGNATRCVADILLAEKKSDRIRIETVAGVFESRAAANGLITADMGAPHFEWAEIPLHHAVDPGHLPLTLRAHDGTTLQDGIAVNVGNPHAVFFVADAEAVPLDEIGPVAEHDPLFPKRVNLEVATIETPDRIRVRVFERGAGITPACGSGACAVLAAAVRRKLLPTPEAEIRLDGGSLHIAWRDDRLWMTGPVAESFRGSVTLDDTIGPAA